MKTVGFEYVSAIRVFDNAESLGKHAGSANTTKRIAVSEASKNHLYLDCYSSFPIALRKSILLLTPVFW